MNINNNKNFNLYFKGNIFFKDDNLSAFTRDVIRKNPIIKNLYEKSPFDLFVVSEYKEDKKLVNTIWEDPELYRVTFKWNKGFLASVVDFFNNNGKAMLSKNFHTDDDICSILSNPKELQERLKPLERK